jgi:PAS domain S-box-containing protein
MKVQKLLQSKLTKRYVFITLIVAFISLTLVYYITIQVLNNSMREQIEYRNNLMSKTISKKTSFMFEKMVDETRIMSEFILQEFKSEGEVYTSEMDRLVTNNPLYLFIHAVDLNGNPFMTIPNVHYSSSSYVKTILERLEWSRSYYISNVITLYDGRKTIAIAYPLINEENEYIGAVIGYVNLSVLSEYLNQEKIGTEGVNALIDRNGIIIAHSEEKYIQQPLLQNELSSYLKKDRFGIWVGELFNQKLLISYRPIETGDFGLIVGESIEQAFTPSRQVQSSLFKSFLVVVMITIILTVIGTSRVVKPITHLIQQAREYKDGKRSNFDIIYTGDELEALGHTLDEMAKELKLKEQRLFYILESIPYGVITTDKDGKVVTFNKGAEELTLYEREEVIGNYIVNIPLKESREEFITWKTLMEGKEFNEYETYIIDKYGIRHDVRLYSSLFSGEDQTIVGAIVILRDVSEIKKLEEFLKQSERLAALGQLTAGIAHEIKNPLSIIQAAAEAIQLELQDRKDEVIHELTEDILETLDRMNDLLVDFLKLAKEQKELKKERVNLIQLLDDLLSLLKNKFAEQNIQVIREYEIDKAIINVNESKMIQVFLNIIVNSLDAMKNTGILQIRVKEKGNLYYEIDIEDTGGGICKSELKWIFNPFYTTKKQGTGLGLSIAHEIITQHNGGIRASVTDKGMIFTIQLPKDTEGDE